MRNCGCPVEMNGNQFDFDSTLTKEVSTDGIPILQISNKLNQIMLSSEKTLDDFNEQNIMILESF